jgi:hypothetical protein
MEIILKANLKPLLFVAIEQVKNALPPAEAATKQPIQ